MGSEVPTRLVTFGERAQRRVGVSHRLRVLGNGHRVKVSRPINVAGGGQEIMKAEVSCTAISSTL